jgi:putative PEP-CTERM system TPR-repeat lipoprotein
MTATAHRYARVVLGLTAALVLAACADDESSLAEHFERARAYRASGDMRAALTELEGVLHIDPDHAEAHWLLGRTYMDLGDETRAREQLARARDLGFVATETVRGEDRASATTPKDARSLLEAGRAHYMRGEFHQARGFLERALELLPEDVSARKLLAAVYIELGQAQRALDLLAPLSAEASDDPRLLAMLGTAHMSRRDFHTGKRYLGQAAELAPDDAAIRTQLAVGYLATGDPGDAIAELEAAVRNSPGFSRADALLVVTHLQNRAFDQAIAAASRLAEKNPRSARVQNLLGAAYEGKQDDAMARQHYRRAVQLNPGYATAALNLARMDLRDGKRDEARAAYAAILERHPDHPAALVALAKMASDQGLSEEGIGLLERARDNNPRALQPRLILAGYHLRRGKPRQALVLAREAYAISPRFAAATLLLGRAQVASGRPDEAISTLSELAERYPDSVETHMQLALAYGQKRDVVNARRALLSVLRIKPEHAVASLGLGTLALRTGRLDEAMAIARALQQNRPQSSAGFALEGDVWMAHGQPHNAVTAYRAALERAPASATVLKLYAARSRAGEAEAIATLSDWLDAHPDDAGVRLAYAATLHQGGDKHRAMAEYQRVLQVQPGSVLALNNLAWLYHEDGDARAIELAERAYTRAPERTEIIDTYGWLLVKDGRVEQGLGLLEKAAQRAPESGDIRYRLAVGLAQAGDRPRARRELTALLDSGREFSQKPAAEALLQALE